MLWMNPAAPGWWDSVLLFLNTFLPLAMLLGAVLVGGGLWMFGRQASWRRGGLILALSPFVANRITGVLKSIVGRMRPQWPDHGLVDELRVIVEEVDAKSFPSGHVTTTAAFVVALFFVLPRMRGRCLLVLLVPTMMWDRIALAVHFPSDTAAGVAVGCFTMAAIGAALRGRDVVLRPAWRPIAIVVAVLVVTSAWSGGTRATDPVSGDEIESLKVSARWERIIVEPLAGPVLEMAWAPGPKGFLFRLLPWAILGVAGLVWMTRRDRRKRLAKLLVFVVAAWAGLMWWGRLPGDAFSADRPGVFFDPHVHGSDPVDGAADVDHMVARIRARGVGVVALTNHDAPPPTSDALAGLEWSGFRHDEQTYLHLLVYGGAGAFDAILEVRIPELTSGEGPARDDALRAVRAAKAAGAIVVVAHYWRTLRQMEIEGTERHLPSPVELILAGVDGFEVANRHWDALAVDRAIVAKIDALCVEHGLLRLASSDDHGKPAGSPVITFLPGTFPADPVARRAAVLAHLRDRRETVPVVFMRAKRPKQAAAVIGGPGIVARYLAGLGLWGRLSWLVWFLLALRWLRKEPGGD
ncbi:MAG: hypothetical protein CMJ83_06000 [Planctomycetes bacterium]|nr:hypothetical protein [Planctomycetota bacterium]